MSAQDVALEALRVVVAQQRATLAAAVQVAEEAAATHQRALQHQWDTATRLEQLADALDELEQGDPEQGEAEPAPEGAIGAAVGDPIEPAATES